jgi:polyhydroxyalkanoate synthesis regulator phasin
MRSLAENAKKDAEAVKKDAEVAVANAKKDAEIAKENARALIAELIDRLAEKNVELERRLGEKIVEIARKEGEVKQVTERLIGVASGNDLAFAPYNRNRRNKFILVQQQDEHYNWLEMISGQSAYANDTAAEFKLEDVVHVGYVGAPIPLRNRLRERLKTEVSKRAAADDSLSVSGCCDRMLNHVLMFVCLFRDLEGVSVQGVNKAEDWNHPRSILRIKHSTTDFPLEIALNMVKDWNAMNICQHQCPNTILH